MTAASSNATQTDGPPPGGPLHVAIIMDGNGRWAAARGLPRAVGHREGVQALKRTIEAAPKLGIGCLTVFGFSTENWNRSTEEVSDLMGLVRGYVASDRHFASNSLLPDVVTIEADHDLRNPAGLIAVERITRQIMAIPGVRMEERTPGSYRLSIRGSLLRSPFGIRNVKVYFVYYGGSA